MVEKKKTGPEVLKKHAIILEPSEDLINRIMADAEQELKPSLGKILWPFGPIWKPAMALSLALMLGVGTGFVIPTESTDGVTYEIETLLGS